MDTLPTITIDDVPAQVVAEIAKNAIAGYREGYINAFIVTTAGSFVASVAIASVVTFGVQKVIEKRKLKKTNLD